ncbi:MAG: hypothetical protein H6610_10140 [Ignavibacteriales bacterium]|nr:hypothetical protein [Ignavibacteriales bacterium]
MNLNKTLKFLIVLAFTLFLFQKNINANSYVAKKGGIAFRTDDNYKIEDILQLKTIFDPYPNFHFSIALNFAGHYNYNGSTVKFDDPSYIAMVQTLQTAGHEIMDHTPNHRTNYFITEFPASEYLEIDLITPITGVNHILELGDGTRKICLEFNTVDLTNLTPIGTCNIENNELEVITGDFSSFDFNTDVYIYLEGENLNKLFFIESFNTNKTEAIIKDLWEEDIDLGIHQNINFYKFTRSNRLSVDGLNVLASETKKIALDLGIVPPKTWIQPGGRHPIISMAELSAALTPLGYTAGASFGDTPQSFKVFNEYDPDDFKKFGIQWEDFNEDKKDNKGGSLENIKTRIADAVAQNKIMIGHNHFYDLGKGDFVILTDYLNKVNELLNWCDEKNIEIKTYQEWADLLYDQIPDPYQNIFPPLDINRDSFFNNYNLNGVPDGYAERTIWKNGEIIVDDKGVWEVDETAPSGYCYTKYYDNWGRIFLVKNLGGLEKGNNEFRISTKGGTNDLIKVVISDANAAVYTILLEFTIPANSTAWNEYSHIINIPDYISQVNIEVFSQYYNPKDALIKVSGMYLAKNKPKIPIDLKIMLEGSYGNNNTMNIDPNFQSLIPDDHPFNIEPWNYTIEDEFENLPTGTIDWVLVELRKTIDANSMETRKAALLLNDGTIINADGTQFDIQVAEGNYYVVIHQRNHLSVMSASTIPFYDVVSN